MSTSQSPATPATPGGLAIAAQTVASNAPTGTWRHPNFDEIHRRLRVTTFGERNIRVLAWNALALLVSFMLPQLGRLHPVLATTLALLPAYSFWVLAALRLVPILGIASALTPLFRSKDDLSDIPLTPSQRALLGLQPASRPATPGSQYTTPPRYSRSATPRSDRSNSGSPLSGKDSPFRAENPYSPSASPLFQKAMSRESGKRLSFGASGSAVLAGVVGDGNTLSPNITTNSGMSKGSSVGLNNRWLYDKGRTSLGSRGIYT